LVFLVRVFGLATIRYLMLVTNNADAATTGTCP
jgi:hypothetical protein